MRWFEVESRFRHDARVKRVRQKFGKDGLASLFLLWGEIADQGARPGVGVHRDGSPLELRDLAEAAGLTVRRLSALVEFCAQIGHVDRDRWEHEGVIVFPAMVRRGRKVGEQFESADRKAAARERLFSRIAARDGKHCCRCPEVERLELERKIPADEGGSMEDANLQIVCVPCGRRRRSERQIERERRQGSPGDPPSMISEGSGMDRERSELLNKTAERDAERDAERPQVPGTGTSTGGVISEAVLSPPIARARILDPGPAPLPLVGEVPRRAAVARFPRGLNPAQNPATVMDGNLPRDHAKCLGPCGGVICYPLGLAQDHARALNTGDVDAALEEVRQFRDRVLAAIPPGQAIGDDKYAFWRAHWAAAHPSAAPPISARSSGQRPGPNPAAARVHAAPGKYDAINRRDQDATRTNKGAG